MITWGVLATGWLAEEKMIPGILRSGHGRLGAIASRDQERAAKVAERFGIPRAYGSIDELLSDPEIDAVYNPLPTALHIDTTVQAIRAGKHVLCEKPLAMNLADAERILTVEPGDIRVMEAFMIRHHPQWTAIREMLRGGEIGEVRAIQSRFCYRNTDSYSGTNSAAHGGGAMLFVGCYPIMLARFLFETEPLRAATISQILPRFGTDVDSTGIMEFPGGKHLSYHVSTLTSRNQSVDILGEAGRISVQIPYNTPETEPVRITVDQSDDLSGASARAIEFEPADHYALEADAFAGAILSDRPIPYGLNDAMANMRALDAALRAAKSGAWEVVRGGD